MTMRPNMGRYIFDIIGDSIFLHDAQFRILFANRVYCREAGKPETLVLGQLYWEIFLPGSGSLPGCRVVAGEQNAKGSADEVHVGDRIFSPGATHSTLMRSRRITPCIFSVTSQPSGRGN
jgi:PAS domain-containing protein